ncbi:SOSS complex subunit C homolog B [Anopheles ziemanni]|uniref:SOSS complex subunit C homolog B n=1 Tax=Anopheles coustani TaxID=139045 RepID=UPI0026590C63|nr:SOSS complex subunit C homolog B [Anopheles coustani]XP_058176492.1 SOSS complex subunit C homolog B [Anopheles ziemanni]
MAFPSPTNQDVTKKILEDIQIKKQLLQKGVNSNWPGFGNLYTPSSLFQLTQYTPNTGQPNESNLNIAKGVWSQAINQSFGFFVPQDSLFGNNILPVLPRYDNPAIHYTSTPKF